MPRGPAVLAVFFFLTLGAERGSLRADLPRESDRIVHYTMDVQLVPELRRIKGKMVLTWRNTSSDPQNHLYFHLYLNAFKDKDSTFMRESRGQGKAGATFDEKNPGRMDVKSIKREDGSDLTLAYVSPDDGNEKDRTLGRVDLPAAVAPGETITLNLEFESTLPRVMHRTGWSGDPENPDQLFFMAAQWFPKVAVLRLGSNGTAVWNAHQFHKNTEFFADYGVYRVSITVPKNYRVGATGKRLSTKEDANTKTVVHEQADVHDFAWCASPQFEEFSFQWSFDTFCDEAGEMGEKLRELLKRTARHLGKTEDAIKPTQVVDVRVLYPKDHAGIRDRFKWSAGASLACYGMWFGQYPYDVLTIMDPPAGGRAAGGMEYPTLITVGGDRNAPWYVTGQEGVTIHEFGHQYFYGLLGSNEFEEAWLDEGFTSYTDARVFEEAYHHGTARTSYLPFHTPYHRPFAAPGVYQRLRDLLHLENWLGKLPRPWDKPDSVIPVPGQNTFWAYLRDMPALHLDRHVRIHAPYGERNGWLASGTHDPMVMNGWDYARRADYRVNSYRKPTVFLYCLRGLLGEETFDKAMYAYAEKYRFKHPTTSDFMTEVRGQTPAERRAALDAFSEAMLETASRLDVAILSASQREVKQDGKTLWEWTVKVQRRGGVPVPVSVKVHGGNGREEQLETWHSTGRETTKTFRALRDWPFEAVRLGPDWLRYCDYDLSNNARVPKGFADRRAAVVVATRWSLYAEEIVRTYAGVSR